MLYYVSLGSTKIHALHLGMSHGLEPPSSEQVQPKVFVLMLLKNLGE